jgi:hypothetical protein
MSDNNNNNNNFQINNVQKNKDLENETELLPSSLKITYSFNFNDMPKKIK